MIPLLLPLLLQSASHALPPATLPAPGGEEQAVMRPVNALFAGMAARDAVAMGAQILPGAAATSVLERPDGTSTVERRAFSDVLARFKPGPERFEESLQDPAIETDGNVGVVWGDYVFRIDGKVHHCGVDHFDLVRENGTWKIANVSWSQRTRGCPSQ